MTALDWTIARAVLYRVTFALGLVVWLAVIIMAYRASRHAEDKCSREHRSTGLVVAAD